MKACITGIFGMDARNLCQLLLDKGYEVVGTYRYSSIPLEDRIKTLPPDCQKIRFVSVDITDHSIAKLIKNEQFDLFFNLCAQSHVGESFINPYHTINVDAMGPLNILEAIRNTSPQTRYYQANTSEMMGSNKNEVEPGIFEQDETTCLVPNSPYGIAKLMAHHLVRIYRESYGIFAVAGILFNHTHPGTRTPSFFERKVSKYVAELDRWLFSGREYFLTDTNLVDANTQEIFPKLALGVIDGVYRDIGSSVDYMNAAYMMLTNKEPIDYVVATGESYPLTEILSIMFGRIGINDYENYIYLDPKLIRPVDVPYLRGNAERIKNELGWKPNIGFKELMEAMVDFDLALVNAKDKVCQNQ